MSISIALVGCGRIGQVHAREIRRVGNLVAVFDLDSKKMDVVVGNDTIAKYQSLKELLAAESDLDLVVIATPNGLHAQQSIECLNHGKHVLCEKPMAIRSVDAESMIKAAQRSGKHLVIVKQNRYNPPIQELKRLLDEGSLGKILGIQVNAFWNRNAEYFLQSSWRGTLELDGGTLFTQFSHFVDLMIWLFGDIDEVKGFRSNVNHTDIIEFEDQGVIALQFESGLQGGLQYTVNTYQKNMEGSITVFGEKGTVKVGGAYLNEMTYFHVDGIERVEGGQSAGRQIEIESNRPNQYEGYQGSMSNHPLVYGDLIRLLNGETNNLASPEDGLRTVRAIEKIYKELHVS
jgi:UDP-N-acetyl-2-amino-2-deoxyglucuronate dehydrogenase